MIAQMRKEKSDVYNSCMYVSYVVSLTLSPTVRTVARCLLVSSFNNIGWYDSRSIRHTRNNIASPKCLQRVCQSLEEIPFILINLSHTKLRNHFVYSRLDRLTYSLPSLEEISSISSPTLFFVEGKGSKFTEQTVHGLFHTGCLKA